MVGLITGWRANWGKPFVFVALAGFAEAKSITNHLGAFPQVSGAVIAVSATLPGAALPGAG